MYLWKVMQLTKDRKVSVNNCSWQAYSCLFFCCSSYGVSDALAHLTSYFLLLFSRPDLLMESISVAHQSCYILAFMERDHLILVLWDFGSNSNSKLRLEYWCYLYNRGADFCAFWITLVVEFSSWCGSIWSSKTGWREKFRNDIVPQEEHINAQVIIRAPAFFAWWIVSSLVAISYQAVLVTAF